VEYGIDQSQERQELNYAPRLGYEGLPGGETSPTDEVKSFTSRQYARAAQAPPDLVLEEQEKVLRAFDEALRIMERELENQVFLAPSELNLGFDQFTLDDVKEALKNPYTPKSQAMLAAFNYVHADPGVSSAGLYYVDLQLAKRRVSESHDLMLTWTQDLGTTKEEIAATNRSLLQNWQATESRYVNQIKRISEVAEGVNIGKYHHSTLLELQNEMRVTQISLQKHYAHPQNSLCSFSIEEARRGLEQLQEIVRAAKTYPDSVSAEQMRRFINAIVSTMIHGDPSLQSQIKDGLKAIQVVTGILEWLDRAEESLIGSLRYDQKISSVGTMLTRSLCSELMKRLTQSRERMIRNGSLAWLWSAAEENVTDCPLFDDLCSYLTDAFQHVEDRFNEAIADYARLYSKDVSAWKTKVSLSGRRQWLRLARRLLNMAAQVLSQLGDNPGHLGAAEVDRIIESMSSEIKSLTSAQINPKWVAQIELLIANYK
jgi:hypothetical protein